jgi:predicted Zn-dependent protease
MARACYDPSAAVSVWKKIKAAETIAPPEFLSTHPSTESRIDTLRNLLPEANLKREAAGCDHAHHLASFWQPKHW